MKRIGFFPFSIQNGRAHFCVLADTRQSIPHRAKEKDGPGRSPCYCLFQSLGHVKEIHIFASLSLPLVQNNNASGTTRSPHRVRT